MTLKNPFIRYIHKNPQCIASFMKLEAKISSNICILLLKNYLREQASCKGFWRRVHRKWVGACATITWCPSGCEFYFRSPPKTWKRHLEINMTRNTWLITCTWLWFRRFEFGSCEIRPLVNWQIYKFWNLCSILYSFNL